MTADRLASNVDVFGGPEPLDSTVRVAVRVPVHLSFVDLLGLLTFEGALTWDELNDESVIREALQYAVLQTNLVTMESYGRRALAAYRGAPEAEDAGDTNLIVFARRVAIAVTRTFGVSA
ncbi:hypothetical protein [Streptomyces sp. NBC_01563]|uniref:hypothetical protein n=1 Tax=Streptomyces sp. NBC_01563 TaxID=2975880 RepID=UPI00386FC83D